MTWNQSAIQLLSQWHVGIQPNRKASVCAFFHWISKSPVNLLLVWIASETTSYSLKTSLYEINGKPTVYIIQRDNCISQVLNYPIEKYCMLRNFQRMEPFQVRGVHRSIFFLPKRKSLNLVRPETKVIQFGSSRNKIIQFCSSRNKNHSILFLPKRKLFNLVCPETSNVNILLSGNPFHPSCEVW